MCVCVLWVNCRLLRDFGTTSSSPATARPRSEHTMPCPPRPPRYKPQHTTCDIHLTPPNTRPTPHTPRMTHIPHTAHTSTRTGARALSGSPWSQDTCPGRGRAQLAPQVPATPPQFGSQGPCLLSLQGSVPPRGPSVALAGNSGVKREEQRPATGSGRGPGGL